MSLSEALPQSPSFFNDADRQAIFFRIPIAKRADAPIGPTVGHRHILPAPLRLKAPWTDQQHQHD
jgi:hypothetical protein